MKDPVRPDLRRLHGNWKLATCRTALQSADVFLGVAYERTFKVLGKARPEKNRKNFFTERK